MTRQYVHLSIEPRTAREVGFRKDSQPIILLVEAGEAYRNGIFFYEGSKSVWLADYIPASYVSLVTSW